MHSPIQYCLTCEGIELHWSKCTQEWTAPYTDGGVYCECPNEEIPKFMKAAKRR